MMNGNSSQVCVDFIISEQNESKINRYECDQQLATYFHKRWMNERFILLLVELVEKNLG